MRKACSAPIRHPNSVNSSSGSGACINKCTPLQVLDMNKDCDKENNSQYSYSEIEKQEEITLRINDALKSANQTTTTVLN